MFNSCYTYVYTYGTIVLELWNLEEAVWFKYLRIHYIFLKEQINEDFMLMTTCESMKLWPT